MGLDADYPAVTMNDPNGHVAVYNQDHVVIGTLGPSPYESPSVNVTCRIKKWDEAYWYRLLNPNAFPLPATSAYVSADETHDLDPGQPYPIPDCADSSCLSTVRRIAGPALAALAAVTGAGAVWWRRRRR
ncbi:hypothetical protein [Actinopolymorpha rutila]|uniref:Uncharacterized protein n=1 Tax=Actinopolymorpha rutila TaxID=446787 RepID=A0A852ZMH4_9ACTN|nr:hypothetical protein [Actinopolymorpha rutila]NYH93483.1 hypothetical protein [Actinopolymorpha rutila]